MDLSEFRKSIDQIDDQILELLMRRMEVVKEVGKLKRTSNTVIYRPEREKAIIDRLAKKAQYGLDRKAIESIYLEIFAVSRNLELPERIAFLGPSGSFTHQAAESRFGAMSEYLELRTIRSVFETISTERARFGIVPIENNQEGVVEETLDLLGSSDLKIVAEIPMAIHFSFACIQDDPRKIRKIYSKDIAFRQCRKFLKDLYPDEQIEMIPVDSTSKAVKIALSEENAAAICSDIAAKLYGLPILFDNIEDSTDNTTRFIILGKSIENQPGGSDKTSILANLPHKPGSLAHFLDDFNQVGVNLSKVESRPAKSGKKFNYRFFIDFDGHRNDEKIAEIFRKHQNHIKWLGSYPKMC